MTERNRQSPAWYEGMTLDPHHFQQWDRHQRFELAMRTRAVAPLAWGFVGLDIDRETLANGQFSLRGCRGITQDGVFFDCPGNNPLPRAEGVKEHFSASGDRLKVYLALPAEQSRGRNCQLAGAAENPLARYVVETVALTDDNTGGTEREIGVCQPSLRIVFGDENLDGYTVLPVAELLRTGDGAYALSDRFIPPCLAMGASENLMRTARNILEVLISKSDALSERRRQQSPGQAEFTTGDVTLLGTLLTVNGHIPGLRAQCASGTGHPEALYGSLVSLAGQLMAFSVEPEMRPAGLPVYDHAGAGDCFAALAVTMGRLLESVLSANFIRIPLERQTESQWMARIGDPALLSSAHFYLAAGGEIPERKLIDELPLRMKVGSAGDLAMLVNAALPGLAVSHTARPPAGLPLRPGLQYYRLEKSGRLWDAIVHDASLALFVPGDFKGVRFELMAVKST